MTLTPAQQKWLKRICETNGAGIYFEGAHGNDQRVIWRLYEKGLVQGKKGQLSRVVHTKEGWEKSKKLQEAQDQ